MSHIQGHFRFFRFKAGFLGSAWALKAVVRALKAQVQLLLGSGECLKSINRRTKCEPHDLPSKEEWHEAPTWQLETLGSQHRVKQRFLNVPSSPHFSVHPLFRSLSGTALLCCP